MRRRLALGAVLVAVWLLLWDAVTPGQLVAGVAVAAALLVLLPAAPITERPLVVRPLPLLRLAGWFVVQFALSNVQVAAAVLAPGRLVRPGVVAVEMRTSSQTLTALVANMTALTPGMQPVDGWRDPNTLYVHVLSLRSEEEARAIVRRLEALVLDAFAEDPAADLTPIPEEGTP